MSSSARHLARVTALLLPAMLFALTGCGGGGSSVHLAEGVELYRQYELEDALRYFVQSSLEKPKDPEAKSWMAETLRRLQRREDAYEQARNALAARPCHSFAHLVLGDLFNPQFGSWGGKADDTIAWENYRRAIECDPDDGNPWLSIWSEAMRRGDTALEERAVQRMAETEFFTPAALAYSRWMLGQLPENAVLIVNGDMDTYPALVLQESEGFRADVAVINVSLLSTSWYPGVMAKRHDLPLSDTPLESYQDAEGNVQSSGKQLVGFWVEQQATGGFSRPLAISVTVADRTFGPEADARMLYSGAFFEVLPQPSRSQIDPERVQAGLASIEAAIFAGPFASNQDRSAVRHAYGHRVAGNLVGAALYQARFFVDQAQPQRALAAAEWAEAFSITIGQADAFADRIEAVKKQAQSDIEGS